MILTQNFRNCVTIDSVDRKGVKFRWSEECKEAFEAFRDVFITVSILVQFNWTKEVIVETDDSDTASADIL